MQTLSRGERLETYLWYGHNVRVGKRVVKRDVIYDEINLRHPGQTLDLYSASCLCRT